MRLFLASLCLLVMCSLKAEEATIAGSWEVTGAAAGGKEVPAEQLKAMLMTFTADKCTLKINGETVDVSSMKLDEEKDPATVVFTTVSEGPTKGEVTNGILTLDGDHLKISTGQPGKERPANFNSPEGATNTVLTLKRKKAKEVPMAGSWEVAAAASAGHELTAEQIKPMTLIFAAEKCTTKMNEDVVDESSMVLDMDKNPPTVVFVTLNEGPTKGQITNGIYELDGDVLKIATAAPGKPKPDDFTSTVNTVLTLKRKK